MCGFSNMACRILDAHGEALRSTARCGAASAPQCSRLWPSAPTPLTPLPLMPGWHPLSPCRD